MIGETIKQYKIIEKIGEGGMGEVWLAEDTTLGRKAALKFLPSGIDPSDEEQARFLREAQAASALDHPNICTIYEAGDTDDGRTFIAMAYCDDETVKAKIKRGPLELDEAIDIAIQIGEGLARAHKEGIVHRDIKPANAILTTDGIVKIVDFGLAKISGTAQLTRTGSSIGTAAYMSPEQVRGDEVDHRADIWSLGVMLYEMVAGQLPFQGDNETAMMYSILNEEPISLVSLQEDIPQDLDAVVGKALVKDQTNRYQSVQKMVEELRKPSIDETGQQEWEKSIVVLPFENMSPDPDQEYFSDGLTEEIITDLSKIHSLRVISRNSAMTMKGTSKTTKIIGRELNVQYVLEGSVRKSGNNLRITAQLIDATNDAHIWAEKYSGTLDDVFEIQEVVSRSIVQNLELKLGDSEKRSMAGRPFNDVKAYDYYLKAHAEISKCTENALDNALRYLQNAHGIIGDNVFLFAGMAWVYWNYVNIGVKQDEYIVKAEECVQKALVMDPEFPKAHALLGWIQMAFHGLKQDCFYHFKRSLAVDPNEPLAIQGLALAYIACGKPSSAVPLCDRLQQIDPLDFVTIWLHGGLPFYNGQFDHALQEWLRLYEIYPENPMAQFYVALILAYHKKMDESHAIIDLSAETNPDHTTTKFGLILKYGLNGDNERAFRELTPEFIKTCERDVYWAQHIAAFLALLNVKKDSLAWLEIAINRGFINYPFLAELDPFLENIRGEVRFQELMKRVKYEWENFEVSP